MTWQRWFLLVGIAVISLVIAFFLRDVVYDVIIIPLAYLLWLGKFYYTAIPQIFLWGLLVLLLFIAVTWNFIPENRPSRRKELMRKPPEGQVEALTLWIEKAQKGNYFKWQLAYRLGRIARKINENYGKQVQRVEGKEAVEKYFDAGLNNSFVDFPTPRNRFRLHSPTPLDMDPKVAVDYLESQMEQRSDRHS